MLKVGLSPRLREQPDKIDGLVSGFKPFEAHSIKQRRGTERKVVENGIHLEGYGGLLSNT